MLCVLCLIVLWGFSLVTSYVNIRTVQVGALPLLSGSLLALPLVSQLLPPPHPSVSTDTESI